MVRLSIYYLLVIRKVWLLMDNVVLWIVVFFLSFAQVYVWSWFYDVRIKFRSIWLWLSLTIITLSGVFGAVFVNAYIKIIIGSLLLILCNYLIFRKSFRVSIICIIYSQFLLTVADIIGVLLIILFFGKDTLAVKDEFFVTAGGNFIVSIVFIVIAFIPFVKRLFLKIVSLTERITLYMIIRISFLIIFSINFLMAVVYYDIKSKYVIIINTILLFIYTFIVYKLLREKNDNIIMKTENGYLMDSLHQYEDMVDRQRVDNHENKNQLLIIKNMIKKKDKDVVKYIDTIVKDQMEDDEALYTRVMTIPSGGLQGIIYQKMLVMKDEHIDFSLDVGRGIRDFKLEYLSMDDNYRLCKIIGVLLDNAIEESRNIQDKCIMISLYIDDDDLIIDVSNRFEGMINLDRLDESGYTTKGDGHGYGLSLVKKILSETNKFENERSIKRNIFKQVVRIKNT